MSDGTISVVWTFASLYDSSDMMVMTEGDDARSDSEAQGLGWVGLA